MSGKTGIEWTDATWNPVTGCTKVSTGCKNCYAETFAERWRGIAGHPYEQGFDLKLHPDRIDQPLRWKKPRRVFVNSMSDLFHEEVIRTNPEFIAKVFAIMSRATQHTFQVLTKRPHIARNMLNDPQFWMMVNSELWSMCVPVLPGASPYVLPNVWIGTSVENQATADERIPQLLDTPAAVRFLSCEPLLGPIDLWAARHKRSDGALVGALSSWNQDHGGGIGWVIVGGESGPGARPINPKWVRDIRDQCIAAGVPFFFKQWGGTNKKKAGRELDGRTWEQMP